MIVTHWSAWRRFAAVGIAMAAMFVAPAQAADDEEQPIWREPNISYADKSGQYVQWTLGVLFAVLCVAMAFKNPHRSHLD